MLQILFLEFLKVTRRIFDPARGLHRDTKDCMIADTPLRVAGAGKVVAVTTKLPIYDL
jgi:hypothetical protein